ncbi:TPA: autotransporter outer membrane beta-barrel domain-containing protein [Photobacterium damselae]
MFISKLLCSLIILFISLPISARNGLFLDAGVNVNSLTNDNELTINPDLSLGFKRDSYSYNFGFKNDGFNLEAQYYNYLNNTKDSVVFGVGLNEKFKEQSYLSLSFDFEFVDNIDYIQIGSRYNLSGELNFYLLLRLFKYDSQKSNIRIKRELEENINYIYLNDKSDSSASDKCNCQSSCCKSNVTNNIFFIN